jgi:hypothetical protein
MELKCYVPGVYRLLLLWFHTFPSVRMYEPKLHSYEEGLQYILSW